MLRFLGFMDLVAGLLFLFIKLNVSKGILIVLFWICFIYLIIKLILFPFNLGSIGDAISLVLLSIAFFFGFGYLSWLGMFWFLQKGLLSLIA